MEKYQLQHFADLGLDPNDPAHLAEALHYWKRIYSRPWDRPPPPPKKKYHLTLTLDPSKGKTVQDLTDYFTKFTKRLHIKIYAAAMEHISDNAHIHILFAYKKLKAYFKASWLDSFKKCYGNFKLQTITPGTDHKVKDYIHKEEPDKKILI